MAQRGVITHDGFLFLEIEPGVYSDGDITDTLEELTMDESGETIEDVDALPHLAERVERIRNAIAG